MTQNLCCRAILDAAHPRDHALSPGAGVAGIRLLGLSNVGQTVDIR